MSGQIVWYYHRPGGRTCAKMDSLLNEPDIEASRIVNVSKTKPSSDHALELLPKVTRLVAAKRRKVVNMDLSDVLDDSEFLTHVIGPAGNLRSPAFICETTVVVGIQRGVVRSDSDECMIRGSPPPSAGGTAWNRRVGPPLLLGRPLHPESSC